MIRYGSTGWFQLRKVSVDWALAEESARRITARTRGESILYLRATAFWVDGAGAGGSTEGMAARNTSLAKKFRPSMGTIMICILSERRSATIFWMSSGLSRRTSD